MEHKQALERIPHLWCNLVDNYQKKDHSISTLETFFLTTGTTQVMSNKRLHPWILMQWVAHFYPASPLCTDTVGKLKHVSHPPSPRPNVIHPNWRPIWVCNPLTFAINITIISKKLFFNCYHSIWKCIFVLSYVWQRNVINSPISSSNSFLHSSF